MRELFPAADYPGLLAGLGEPDDAAVYRLGGGRVLLLTADFFPPVVDDAYDFGAIAAVNAMSDVFAMGGDPVLALNLAMLPSDMPSPVSDAIMRGAAEAVAAAGAVIAGGHTMDDREPKFGLVVLGFAAEERLTLKGGVSAGQALVLSKPLGIGVLTTAAKRGVAEPAWVVAASASMKRSNQQAAAAMRRHGVRGATDVTGFGLLGHALELADASGVRLRFDFDAIPFLDGSLACAAQGVFPGGALRNRRYCQPRVAIAATLGEAEALLLFDPQTSGGLLLAVDGARAGELLAELRATGHQAAVVGEALAGGDGDGGIAIEISK